VHYVEPKFDDAIEKTLRKHWASQAASRFEHVAIGEEELCSCCNNGRLLPSACFEGAAR